jgi:hypothetical protein
MKGSTIAIGLLVAATAACGNNSGLKPSGIVGTGGSAGGTLGPGGSGGSGGKSTTFTFDAVVNRNVDVLFMLDDSSNMSVLQSKLVAAIPSYFAVLKALPGGLPNIHLGIVSSSMGAGRNPSIDHCPQGGDQGVFRTRPLGTTCAQASLNPGQNFIINTNGQANYTGDIADVFSCIALLGDGGCGFEHQFASVLRAVGADGAPPPVQNANFLRPDAYLQIVLLTDEDDCSAPPDSDLFDPYSGPITTDPLGPLQSYRCNEFGHLCGGKRPPRQPPGEVDLGTCVSAEDGRLLRVKDIAAALQSLKADPRKIMVAAITGPPKPYKVNVGPSQVQGDPSMWPYVEHACMQMDPNGSYTVADPAVRTNQLIASFGANGRFENLCAESFIPAVQDIAGQIAQVMGVPCLAPNIDPDKCSFVDSSTDSTGKVTNMPLARCTGASDPGPCWEVGQNNGLCSQPLIFKRPGVPAGTGSSTTGTCAL